MPRRPPLLRLVGALILVGALLASGCAASDEGEPLTVDAEVWTFDGEPRNLSELTGQPLVINFFAESCAPCVAEMPMFQQVHDSLDGAVDFVGVSEDVTAGAAQEILELTGITYLALWDREGTALGSFDSFGLPSTVFVNSDGTVERSRTGALSEDQLREFIGELS